MLVRAWRSEIFPAELVVLLLYLAGLGFIQAAHQRYVEPVTMLCLGIFFHLAETREKAVREITPFYEEHVKMFAPLGFVPGITSAQVEAAARRGGWGAAGVPTVEHYMKTGAWFAGPPEELAAYLEDLESRFPGLQHVNMSISMGTPKAVMQEQLRWFGKEVMPRFATRAR